MERPAPGSAEHAPGRDQVGGRITDADAAEVDDRAEAAVGHQQVRPQQVGVYPHRRPIPGGGGQRVLPRRKGRAAVDDLGRRLDGRARPVVKFAQRPAPGLRRSGDGDLTQFADEPSQVLGRLAFICDELLGVRLDVDPAVDGPGEGVPVRRIALRHRLGDPQRQARCELRQPVALPLQGLGPRWQPRQPRAQMVSQPVDGVHRSRRRNGADRQPAQPRELRGDQPPDETGVDVDLTVMHLHPGSLAVDSPGRGGLRITAMIALKGVSLFS